MIVACGDDEKSSTADTGPSGDTASDTTPAGDTGGDTAADTTPGDVTPSKTVTLVFDEGGPDDASFNYTANQGLTRAEAELTGVTAVRLDYFADGLTREEAFEQAAESSQLVIGVGFSFAETAAAIAPDYPDVHFAILDGEGDELDNVSYHLYAANEGSFLVGAAAALVTKSKKIGFIGGLKIPLIDAFEAGFRAGVAHIAADAVVDTVHVAEDFSGFGNPEKAKEDALRMYGAGDDVIYHAAGLSGMGLFEAAADFSEAGDDVWAIGVDTDQYLVVEPAQQPYILTSMLKRIDVTVFNLASALAGGDAFPTGYVVGGLKEGLVGYATSGGHLDDIAAQLEALAADIEDGTITVPSEL